jgi:hypothetical protein
MARQYTHEDIATVPRGWHVRTVRSGDHEVRLAFPPGGRRKGSGKVVSILHPNGENPTCTLRHKNPAELLLMGANPHSREKQRTARERAERIRGARLNPIFTEEFTTEEKLCLGRLGIAWSGIQNPGDVRKARRAIRDAQGIRRRFRKSNPMGVAEQREQAQEIYTGFHATPPENKLILDEPHIPEGVYPELGLLISIKFKPGPDAAEPYEKLYVVAREDVHVIGSLARDQIHFAGGDQRIDDKTLRYFGWKGSEQNFQLGEAREIVYLARKYHSEVQENARGELVEWVHKFGEETGALPQLWYDTRASSANGGNVGRIYLKHGEYSIRDEGITN